MMENLENDKITLPKKPEGGRILALDAVRGLAVLGMYIQHFALNQWNSDLVSGNTMILFMLCSGISYSLMGAGARRKGMAQEQLRTRILSRSILIDLAGYFLILLNGPFGVVLPAYAMLFLLAMPLYGRTEGQLLRLSCLLYVICPPLMIIGLSLFSGAALLADIAGGPLSALAWAPIFVVGMAIGRMDLRNRKLPARLAGTGLALLVPVKLFCVTVLPQLRMMVENWMVQAMAASGGEIDPYAVWPRNTQPVQWHMLFVEAPQGGSLFELLTGTGLSLIVLGCLLRLGQKKMDAVLKPFAAVGKASLTLYMAQFVLAWVLQLAGIDVTGLEIGSIPFGDILVACAVLAAGCLLARWKEAPMEWAVRRFEKVFLGHGRREG